MFAVEFDARIDSGTIKIPDKYMGRLGSKVKVIILTGETMEEKSSPVFNSIAIRTKGFKLDRETANER
jgi:hypothetical protein